MLTLRFKPFAALAVAALVLVAGWVTLGPVSSAQAASDACQAGKGVTLVVNFGSLPGGVQTTCVSTATSSWTGLKALQAAHQVSGTAQYDLAFICRIDDQPGPGAEKCVKTPPPTAYWSYWYATANGSWTYSKLGVASHHVIVGGYEGWAFHSGSGANQPPTSTPPPHAAPPSTPKPTKTAKPGNGSGSGGSSGSGKSGTGSGSNAGSGKANGPTDRPTVSGTKATATSTASPSGTAAATAGDTPDPSVTAVSASAANPLPDDGGGTSPLPFILGAVAVLLLLAGTALVVRRRRGVDDGG